MIELLILSVGLAMDAFAVSLVRGAAGQRSPGRAAQLGLAFGLAQGLMPLLGWGLGLTFVGILEDVDHWIAFTLLLVLGGRMLAEAAVDGSARAPGRHGWWLGLATAAFATSIDAAAAGITLPLMGLSIPLACLTIGVTTALLCTLGYLVGARAGPRLGRGAAILGGLVLIGLGIKILVEHLAA